MEERDTIREFAWAAEFAEQDDGRLLVSFPDFPEALTEAGSETEALTEAQDCLIAALGGYMAARRPIPRPSASQANPTIVLPALAAAKVALYSAMIVQGVSNTALAKKLGLSEGAIRRLIHLDHRSHIGQVDKALQVLGGRLTVTCGSIEPGPKLPIHESWQRELPAHATRNESGQGEG